MEERASRALFLWGKTFKLLRNKINMRIAVVGKWGSGKTTTSALLASYLGSVRKKPLLIDADINVHLPALFMREEFPIEKYLSSPENMRKVKGYLIGNNHRIASLAAFRKTTPPTKESQLFVLSDAQNYLYQNFTQDLGTLFWWQSVPILKIR